jgi:hypothetical protein
MMWLPLLVYKYATKSHSAYSFDAEQPIAAPILKKEVTGPDAENVTMGFLSGNKAKDVSTSRFIGQISTNGKAGLMDLNPINRVTGFTLIDYGVLYMQGAPTLGQC